MGNANGREESGGENSPSDSFRSARVGMTDQDGSYHANVGVGGGGGVEYMGQSPPASPRATQSPPMFRPQMPTVPLRRPDELRVPNPSWMQTANSTQEEVLNEQCIPTMITWSYGGKDVAVEGSWDDWKSRKPLQRSGKDFTIMKVLPSGVYRYRFIVDGHWTHSPDHPSEQDESGHSYNILDLQDYVPEDLDSISSFEPPQSPVSSYNNALLGPEDFQKEPPLVPSHLNSTLLNVPSPQMEIPPPHSRPQHVVLNHLYMHKDRTRPSVVALGSTNRFLNKYVTVVLYKSIQREVRR